MTARRLVTAILLLLNFQQAVLGFEHVPNSPCADLCSGNPQNTLVNDVVCLDGDYFNTPDGQAFRKCVACELNSTAVDTAINQSDVDWGLCMLCKVALWRHNTDTASNIQHAIHRVRMPLRKACAENQYLQPVRCDLRAFSRRHRISVIERFVGLQSELGVLQRRRVR